MASDVSVKVKFGDKIRRFRADDIKTLIPNLNKLKHKIVGLFNFAYKCDFTLKYIDEDGDEVSLLDDDDVSELLRQSLNPLTILVTLKPDHHDVSSVDITGSRRFADEVLEHSQTLTLRATIDLTLELINAWSLVSSSVFEKFKDGGEFEEDEKKLEQEHNNDSNDGKEINMLKEMILDCSELIGKEAKRYGVNSNLGLVQLSELKFNALSSRTVTTVTGIKPLGRFTQRWWMRNVGFEPWPKGTTFVRIGGNSLTNTKLHEIKIPENGLRVGESINIALEITAPEQPGGYTSFWKMSLPSGETFGDRIQLSIKVDDASTRTLTERRLKAHKLASNIGTSAWYRNLGCDYDRDREDKVIESDCIKSSSNDDGNDNDSSGDVFVAEAEDDHSVEDKECSVWAKLSEMGFSEDEITKEVLRVHGYDIERSMDYLCGVSEWDLILEDLHEMGFKS